jgi:hypothetical protein
MGNVENGEVKATKMAEYRRLFVEYEAEEKRIDTLLKRAGEIENLINKQGDGSGEKK